MINAHEYICNAVTSLIFAFPNLTDIPHQPTGERYTLLGDRAPDQKKLITINDTVIIVLSTRIGKHSWLILFG